MNTVQTTIYISPEASHTVHLIRDMDFYDRSDDNTGLALSPGYYLQSAKRLHYAVLPIDAHVAMRLTHDNPALYQQHVSIPTNLRGCVFENALNLPDTYAEIVQYWSGEPLNNNTSGAVYFQNPLNEYMVDISALDQAIGSEEVAKASMLIDRLLTEGVVVFIRDVTTLISGLSAHDYIELEMPINLSMLGSAFEDFISDVDYDNQTGKQYEQVFLMVADILNSPDPDRIYIDLIRHELIDYGYLY